MRKIIDIHAHLGDIFHSNQNVIWKLNVRHGDYPSPFERLENADFDAPLLANLDELPELYEAGAQLNFENTLENLTKKLNSENITYVVLLPILPNTNFEEYLAASCFEPRILPFTSADFTLPIPELTAKLEQDIVKGAKGLKIHTILQNVSFEDPRVHAAVQVLGIKKKPVLFHCGANDYYTEDKPWIRTPGYGDLKDFIDFAVKYPDFVFIAGHGGGLFGGEMEMLRDNWSRLGDHVYVDTSFRSAKDIRTMVEYFGADKVLYGTDLPFTTYPGSVRQVEKAFPDNAEIREKIFYRNAARILQINA